MLIPSTTLLCYRLNRMRYEKKFTFSSLLYDEVKESLLRSSYLFKEAFPPRRNNTLYLDNNTLGNYRDNIAGLSKRSKARLRWYTGKGNLSFDENTEFYLEIKIRKNFLGDKITEKISLPKNILEGSYQSLINFLIKSVSNNIKPFLTPCTELSLGVSYDREYYQSQSLDLRCTIDNNLIYWDITNNNSMKYSESNWIPHIMEYSVLEIKCDPETYRKISTSFEPFFQSITMGRHSKYAVGLSLVNK